MLPIKYVTIHCAATPEGKDIPPRTVDKWGHEKFGQSSYHYIIALDGTFFAPLKHSQRGAHVGGNNTHNIGICYVGGLTKDGKRAKDTRTVEQKRTMRTIVRTVLSRHGLTEEAVRGHRDWPNVAKDCPSFDVRKWVAAGMPTE